MCVFLKKKEISLCIRHPPEVGIPRKPWEKDGWQLTPSKLPTVSVVTAFYSVYNHVSLFQLYTESLTKYKPGEIIPSFSITLQLNDVSNPKILMQDIHFTGVKPATAFLSIVREPAPTGIYK